MVYILALSQFQWLMNVNCEEIDGIFESSDYWNVIDKPVMSNGHIGFVPYGNSIYMNGLYTGHGHKGNSHRARLPNYGYMQFEPCSPETNFVGSAKCSYALDINNGVFRTKTSLSDGQFTVEQFQYAHRYYETAIVNQIRLKRNKVSSSNGKWIEIQFFIDKKPNFTFNFQIVETFQLHLSTSNDQNSDDIIINSLKSIKILDQTVVILEATTTELEDPKYQPSLTTVTVLYEKIPNLIMLLPQENEMEFTWITLIQHNSTNIEETFQEIHKQKNNLFSMHANEWIHFWTNNKISAIGNDYLTNAIQASIYALVSSLPSLNTSQPRSWFYGLSPAGIGLDRQQEVYNGHSFWDTEIWMQPTVLLLEPAWSKELLNYRYLMRRTARDNAAETGYKGYRSDMAF